MLLIYTKTKTMKTLFKTLMCAAVCTGLFACTGTSAPDATAYDIVPRPLSLEKAEGVFKIDAATQLEMPAGNDWEAAATFFKNLLSAPTGFTLATGQGTEGKNVIRVVQNDQVVNPEGYILRITPEVITIDAKTAAGAFYAFQTLRQMLPVEVESAKKVNGVAWAVPCATITDEPRFGYRGMHLDVARHFRTVDEVKTFIDLLAMHKMNRFHWHLTDDQGWRIEIKKYPKLAEIAAWRDSTLVGRYRTGPDAKYDNIRHGGFYTQDEIRDVVKYAQGRFIEIIPEVDLPGHMSALLTAYPEYGVTGGPYKVQGTWGVFEDLLMPSEATFSMLEDIFTEVIDLFPGRYIHLGGDEAIKPQWKNSPDVQAIMRRLKLKNEEEMQNYFVTRIANFISSKGRTVIGWDEILEGGKMPSATIIMAWRGANFGVEAAHHGNRSIMTPTSHCYFDYAQSRGPNEPIGIGGFIPLEKVYSLEPVPAELTPEQAPLIHGVQANIWTEYIKTVPHLQYMMLPRACALAEVQWTPANTKNYGEFVSRLTRLLQRFDVMGVNYAKHVFEAKASIETKPGENVLTLTAASPDWEIRYATKGSKPSVIYDSPVSIKQSGTFTAQTFKNKKPLGPLYQQAFVIHKAVGASVTMEPATPNRSYNPGVGALVNGIEGGPLHTDGTWLGFAGVDVQAVIDLGAPQEIKSVSANFQHLPQSQIYAPKQVTVLVSEDGNEFTNGVEVLPIIEAEGIMKVTATLKPVQARYVKVEVTNYGVIPANMPGQGRRSWLFIDEVEVE